MLLHRAIASVAFAGALAAPCLALTSTADSAPPGTKLAGIIQDGLSTKTTNAGDAFVVNETILPEGNPSFEGAKIYGHVARVVHASQGRKAELKLRFDRIVFADGYAAPLDASLFKLETQKPNDTAKYAIAAVVGDVVGNYLGKHVGTNWGGFLGAAGGVVYAANAKDDFSVPQGSTLVLELNAPLAVRGYRQPMQPGAPVTPVQPVNPPPQ